MGNLSYEKLCINGASLIFHHLTDINRVVCICLIKTHLVLAVSVTESSCFHRKPKLRRFSPMALLYAVAHCVSFVEEPDELCGAGSYVALNS